MTRHDTTKLTPYEGFKGHEDNEKDRAKVQLVWEQNHGMIITFSLGIFPLNQENMD